MKNYTDEIKLIGIMALQVAIYALFTAIFILLLEPKNEPCNYLSPGAPIYGPQVVPNATDVQTGEPIYINPDGNVYRVR